MIKRISHFIEPGVDTEIITKAYLYGVTKLAIDTRLNPPTIVRWLNGSIGMRDDWYKRIIRKIKNINTNGKIYEPMPGRGHRGVFVLKKGSK